MLVVVLQDLENLPLLRHADGVVITTDVHLQHALHVALHVAVKASQDGIQEGLPELVVRAYTKEVVGVYHYCTEEGGVADVVYLWFHLGLLPSCVTVEDEVLESDIPLSGGLPDPI